MYIILLGVGWESNTELTCFEISLEIVLIYFFPRIPYKALQTPQSGEGISGRHIFLGFGAPTWWYHYFQLWGKFLCSFNTPAVMSFQPPILLSSFKFVSGNAEHPSDRFINTTCEVLPDDPKKAVTLSKLPQLKDGFFIVGGFDNFGVAEGTIGQEVGKIKQFRLNIHSTGENWAILSEINLKKVTWWI